MEYKKLFGVLFAGTAIGTAAYLMSDKKEAENITRHYPIQNPTGDVPCVPGVFEYDSQKIAKYE